MTVGENMGFALKLKGVSKSERDAQVLQAAKLLDLERYLDRKPKALSGGQRVAMGRAIVRSPAVFLMDEPLSNLDGPEAFEVATDGQPGLELRVDIAEELGADAYVYGTSTLDSGEEQFVVRVDGKHVPRMGDTVTLIVPPGNEHAFHPETGERLGD